MGGFGAQRRCDEALAHQEVDLAGVFLPGRVRVGCGAPEPLK